jgi:hypothetical protein
LAACGAEEPRRATTSAPEVLAAVELADGRTLRLGARGDGAGACLVLSGVDRDDRACGRPALMRVPPVTEAVVAEATAQRSPDAPLEIYGATSDDVDRVAVRFTDSGGMTRTARAVLLVADAAERLERSGIHGPFGYFFAELPPRAEHVVATGYDEEGQELGSADYAHFRDLHPHVFISGARR